MKEMIGGIVIDPMVIFSVVSGSNEWVKVMFLRSEVISVKKRNRFTTNLSIRVIL